MKAEHPKEVGNLLKILKAIEERLTSLNAAEKLEILLPGMKSIQIYSTNPQFSVIKAATRSALNSETASIHRRLNQIGFSI